MLAMVVKWLRVGLGLTVIRAAFGLLDEFATARSGGNVIAVVSGGAPVGFPPAFPRRPPRHRSTPRASSGSGGCRSPAAPGMAQ
jgi:hypothetical protein